MAEDVEVKQQSVGHICKMYTYLCSMRRICFYVYCLLWGLLFFPNVRFSISEKANNSNKIGHLYSILNGDQC